MASPFRTQVSMTGASPFTADDGKGGTQGNADTTDLDTAGMESMPGPGAVSDDTLGLTPGLPFSGGDATTTDTDMQETGIVSDVSGLVENLIVLALIVVGLQLFDIIDL